MNALKILSQLAFQLTNAVVDCGSDFKEINDFIFAIQTLANPSQYGYKANEYILINEV